jgi:ribosome maturation factor RimP
LKQIWIEKNKISLEVASVGVGSPLKMIRQYKNIGRMLIVKLQDSTIIEATRRNHLNKSAFYLGKLESQKKC